MACVPWRRVRWRRRSPAARAKTLAGFGDSTVFVEKLVTTAPHRGADPGRQPRLTPSSTSMNATVRCSSETRRWSRSRRRPGSTPPCASGYWTTPSRSPARPNTPMPAPWSSSSIRRWANAISSKVQSTQQVEHTVTEQVTGVDLVEAQFRIASGETLEAIGVTDRAAVEPRGFAVQARITATGPSTITGYKEPTGPGVRVVAQPGLGARSHLTRWTSSRSRACRPISGSLRAILSNPDVAAGDARATTLLVEHPELTITASGGPAASGALALFEQQAAALSSQRPGRGPCRPKHALPCRARWREGVECPCRARSPRVSVAAGATVAAGDT